MQIVCVGELVICTLKIHTYTYSLTHKPIVRDGAEGKMQTKQFIDFSASLKTDSDTCLRALQEEPAACPAQQKTSV